MGQMWRLVERSFLMAKDTVIYRHLHQKLKYGSYGHNSPPLDLIVFLSCSLVPNLCTSCSSGLMGQAYYRVTQSGTGVDWLRSGCSKS
jgi:hypothetical protein